MGKLCPDEAWWREAFRSARIWSLESVSESKSESKSGAIADCVRLVKNSRNVKVCSKSGSGVRSIASRRRCLIGDNINMTSKSISSHFIVFPIDPMTMMVKVSDAIASL